MQFFLYALCMSSIKEKCRRVDWKQFFLLLLILVVVIFLWDWKVLFPLKILVVFFHEFSHAVAAWITGGSVVEIRLNSMQGGLCITRGGWRFVVLSAGYLGSLAWGGLILRASAGEKFDKAVVVYLGLLLLGVTIWLIRPLFGFGFLFGVISGIILLVIGFRLPGRFNDLVLKTIGMTSCLYVLFDIKDDILDRPEINSDARMLGELTGLPTLFWGILWIVIAALLCLLFLSSTCRKPESTRKS